jgi:hypothetical protein
MRRLLNPDLVVGFLVATVLWIGVLGWQASYAPTDSEKRQCEETATKSGHKAEECKTLWERTTTDPVAFFTFWLVIFTGALGGCTIMLWRAGERQLRHSEATAERQLRAYILPVGRVLNGDLQNPSVRIVFRNTGQTPATNVVTWVGVGVRKFPFTGELTQATEEYLKAASRRLLGPSSESTFVTRPIYVQPENQAAIRDGQSALYCWGKTVYDDVFGRQQYQTFRFYVGGDIGIPIDGAMTDDYTGNEAS